MLSRRNPEDRGKIEGKQNRSGAPCSSHDAEHIGLTGAQASGKRRTEGLAIWVPWPLLSGPGMDGHGQARTNTDGLVRGYGISQNPLLHPSSFILHPSSFIPHPSSFILHPSSLILHPLSFILRPSSFRIHPFFMLSFLRAVAILALGPPERRPLSAAPRFS